MLIGTAYNTTPYPVYNNKNSVSFKSNPNSKRLEFLYNDFFVNINGYGKNKDWAKNIKTIADNAVAQIKTSVTSDEVLPSIAKGVKEANKNCYELAKVQHSGILRTTRKGYGEAGKWQGHDLVTKIINQYKSYEDKFTPRIDTPLKNPFGDISLTTVQWCSPNKKVAELVHGADNKVNNALDRVGGKFFNLKKDFISSPENVTPETLPKINSDVAEIRWIMAHSMPWERGSDAISNVFMRALYKSMGIKTYPIKKGVSLDLEAFCTPLADYKKNFTSYFETSPKVMM